MKLVFSTRRDKGIWDRLAYKMNINKITYNKNECVEKRKKNLFVTIINFSSFFKGLFYKKEKHYQVLGMCSKHQIQDQIYLKENKTIWGSNISSLTSIFKTYNSACLSSCLQLLKSLCCCFTQLSKSSF